MRLFQKRKGNVVNVALTELKMHVRSATQAGGRWALSLCASHMGSLLPLLLLVQVEGGAGLSGGHQLFFLAGGLRSEVRCDPQPPNRQSPCRLLVCWPESSALWGDPH